MGLGDFLKGVGGTLAHAAYVGSGASTAVDIATAVKDVATGDYSKAAGKALSPINIGKDLEPILGSNAVKSAVPWVTEHAAYVPGLHQAQEKVLGKDYLMSTGKELGQSAVNLGRTASAASNPEHWPTVAKGVYKAGEFTKEHPGQAWDIGFGVGKHMLKEQLRPENLITTAALAATTFGVGAVAAEGARAAQAVSEASEAAKVGQEALGVAEAAQGVSKAGRSMQTFDQAAGAVSKQSLSPVTKYVTQPLRDKAAQAILNAGGEAGVPRQVAAAMVQGQSGTMPTELAGMGERVRNAQEWGWRLNAGQKRLSQTKLGEKVLHATADPVGYAKSTAMSHKGEALNYASEHPQQVAEGLQKYQQAKNPSGMADTGLQRARESLAGGGGGGVEPPQFQQTGGGVPEEPEQAANLSSNQFNKSSSPSQAFQPVQQPVQQKPVAAQGSLTQPVSQQGKPSRVTSWYQSRTPRVQAGIQTVMSLKPKSSQHFWQGPGREAFGGIGADYDWRSIGLRAPGGFSVNIHRAGGAGDGGGGGGEEPESSNVREPRTDTPPSQTMSASAEPYMSIGDQPTGALNPAVPRTIQPAKAPGSERKIAAQQNRSEFFKSGSVFDRNVALPPLSQPVMRPQRDVLGV